MFKLDLCATLTYLLFLWLKFMPQFPYQLLFSRYVLSNPSMAPLSMWFSRQEYWSVLPFPSPGDLPDPGSQPVSPASSTVQADSLPLSHLVSWRRQWQPTLVLLPGKSTGSLRVGLNCVTSLSLFLSCIGEGNGNPLQCSCLENPRDGGAWWAAIYEVAQSRTRLKWLSSSSSTW